VINSQLNYFKNIIKIDLFQLLFDIEKVLEEFNVKLIKKKIYIYIYIYIHTYMYIYICIKEFIIFLKAMLQ